MTEQSYNYESTPSSLEDLQHYDTPEEASKGQRLANYLIDLIAVVIMYLVVCVFLGFALGIYNAFHPQDRITNFSLLDDDGIKGKFVQYLLSSIATIIYYSLAEGLLIGRSLGKLITGTQAVDLDTHQPVTFGQAFYRSVCRCIPFAPLVALFGTPLHDSIPRTTVIKKRK